MPALHRHHGQVLVTWRDRFGVVHSTIRVVEEGRKIVWDTVCFYAVRIPERQLDGLQDDYPITCLICLVDPWRP